MLAGDPSSRSRILDAAGKAMAKNGFAGTSMRSLANLVGLHPGSIYHHFSSKQQLLCELLFEQQRRRLESTRAACSGKCPALALSRMMKALWRDTRTDCLHLSLRTEARYLTAQELETYNLREGFLIRAFEHVLELGIRQGNFVVDDASGISRAIIAVIEESAQRADGSLQRVQTTVQRLVGLAGWPTNAKGIDMTTSRAQQGLGLNASDSGSGKGRKTQ